MYLRKTSHLGLSVPCACLPVNTFVSITGRNWSIQNGERGRSNWVWCIYCTHTHTLHTHSEHAGHADKYTRTLLSKKKPSNTEDCLYKERNGSFICERALFSPEERCLWLTKTDTQPERTQGERPSLADLIHTSCRSESSNISLVVLDKESPGPPDSCTPPLYHTHQTAPWTFYIIQPSHPLYLSTEKSPGDLPHLKYDLFSDIKQCMREEKWNICSCPKLSGVE